MDFKIYKEIESLLIGKNGILIDLRFGEGLDNNKVREVYKAIEKLNVVTYNNRFIPKFFFNLIIDSIMVITSSIDSNENKDKILIFLDKFTDLLKGIDMESSYS